MSEFDATEQAYRNGYEAGKAEAMKWVSVKERLPEVGQKVLACGVHKGMEVQQFHGAHFLRDGTCVWEWKHNTIKTVTHWMPLPEPPENGV